MPLLTPKCTCTRLVVITLYTFVPHLFISLVIIRIRFSLLYERVFLLVHELELVCAQGTT